MTAYSVETRAPHQRYVTVKVTGCAKTARWIFDQHLVPGGRLAVRIRELPSLRVVARATPKR